MNASIKFFTLALIGLFFTTSCSVVEDLGIGCDKVTANHTITTQSYDLTNYAGLDVSGSWKVYVRFSDTENSIEVETHDNLHAYMKVEERNNELNIGFKNNTCVNGIETANVYITTTQTLTSFDGSGASDFIIEDRLIANNLDIDLSGSAHFTADLDVNSLLIDSSGSSDFDFSGTADRMSVDASGSSSIQDYALTVGKLNLDLSGKSIIYLTVTDEISIEASGSSEVYYKGNAIVTDKDLSGSAKIQKIN